MRSKIVATRHVSWATKTIKIAFAADALPRTPLGSLQRIPSHLQPWCAQMHVWIQFTVELWVYGNLSASGSRLWHNNHKMLLFSIKKRLRDRTPICEKHLNERRSMTLGKHWNPFSKPPPHSSLLRRLRRLGSEPLAPRTSTPSAPHPGPPTEPSGSANEPSHFFEHYDVSSVSTISLIVCYKHRNGK